MKSACFSVMVLMAASALATPDVFIGTSGLGHVSPAAAYPFGMVQAGPDTSARPEKFVSDWAHTCGYQHTDEWLWRFSQTHLFGTGCPSFGDIGLLPYAAGFDGSRHPAKMLKATERGEAGHYAVTIDEDGERVDCEVAALARSAVYRFRFSKPSGVKLLIDLDWGIGNPGDGGCWGRYVVACDCAFVSPTRVVGWRRVFNWGNYMVKFTLDLSAPVVAHRQLMAGNGVRGEIHELDFGELSGGELEARLTLGDDMQTEGFEATLAAARDGWRRFLSRIELDPATDPETRKSFESALYRTLIQPNETVTGRYSTLSLWDTFRAAHPLYTIVAPEYVDRFVNSMLDQCDEQGYLPIWALGGDENHCMIGHHAVPVIVDAYLKGFRGFDAERAWRAIRNSLTVNHHAVNDATWGLMKEDWPLLDKYGYIPFDLMTGGYGGKRVIGEAAARTLECAYDDACAARMAKALGHAQDAEFFAKRANAWRNLFDPSTGFIRGKDSKGRWREPFDPWALGGGPWTDNDFCEGNAWQYTWHVMHDPEGLIAALGGRERFLARLTELFTQPPHEYKDRPTGDVSGLIGQYAHGNEPSHHVIYFFTLAGRPDLAGKYVRQVFDTQYSTAADGLCGNDDCGQMAAWYVFSALGFYPFDPCGGTYVIGAPQVPLAKIALPGGKTLKVVANGFARERPCVGAARLNGRVLKDFTFTHAELLAGGTLEFDMAP